jgi:hypothetical protein
VDELLMSTRRAAVDVMGVGSHRVVERRQHSARLGDLCWISYIEEIAIDDGNDAERSVVELYSKATVSCRNWSGNRDAAVVKPHGKSCRIGQALEQIRDHGPFRDEAPVIGRDPRQQVSVTDDQAIAVINRDCPGVPKGVTYPADRGNSIGEAEALAKSFFGVG